MPPGKIFHLLFGGPVNGRGLEEETFLRFSHITGGRGFSWQNLVEKSRKK
ncbi:hypothetical protein J14TS2_17330 [Bacillus sp. J14TS2]|nr:hypothetical protein J14TS2_17330 [Bacillus sp. J14TS2]